MRDPNSLNPVEKDSPYIPHLSYSSRTVSRADPPLMNNPPPSLSDSDTSSMQYLAPPFSTSRRDSGYGTDSFYPLYQQRPSLIVSIHNDLEGAMAGWSSQVEDSPVSPVSPDPEGPNW
jgi:hypothetical protein